MRRLLTTVRTWGELVKFSHSVFALPLALLATFLAARPSRPSAVQLGLIVGCMVTARSAAMTFNRLVDARYDASNPRTAGRPLPRGAIRAVTAWGFFVGAAGMFVIGCAAFLWLHGNPWPLALAGPMLAWLCLYSYTKRFTRWSHVWLGFGIALAPVAAWLAVNPQTLGLPALCLLIAATFWIGGFDLIYACQDVDFDRRAGLHSVPARMGVAAALRLARVFHTVTGSALIAVGLTAGLGLLYYVGAASVIALLIVENTLVSPHDLRRVNTAFFTINGVVGLLLGALGVMDIVLS